MTVLGILGLIGVVLVTNWGNYLKVSDEQLRSLGLSAGKLRLALLGLAVFLARHIDRRDRGDRLYRDHRAPRRPGAGGP
ncbi:hypothetical protein ACW18Z_05210 [Limosilactobacillus fermentum]